jgi:hypothetical protein
MPETTSNLHWFKKCAVLFAISAIAALIQMAIEDRWPQGLGSFAANLIGAALAFWLVSLVFAGFVRGWSGVVVGAVVIAIFSIPAGCSASKRRHDREQFRYLYR